VCLEHVVVQIGAIRGERVFIAVLIIDRAKVELKSVAAIVQATALTDIVRGWHALESYENV